MIKGVLQHLQRHEDALESHQPETDSPVGGFQPAAGADTLPDSDLHKGGTVHSVPGYSQYFSAVDFISPATITFWCVIIVSTATFEKGS